MNTLILFGAKVKWDNELEVISEDEFGMDITIHMVDGTKQTRHNCTEFHHLFDSYFEQASAFESDIHSTGGTIDLKRMTKIEVIKATKLNETY